MVVSLGDAKQDDTDIVHELEQRAKKMRLEAEQAPLVVPGNITSNTDRKNYDKENRRMAANGIKKLPFAFETMQLIGNQLDMEPADKKPRLGYNNATSADGLVNHQVSLARSLPSIASS